MDFKIKIYSNLQYSLFKNLLIYETQKIQSDNHNIISKFYLIYKYFFQKLL